MHAVLKNSSLGSSGAQNPRQFLSDLRDFLQQIMGYKQKLLAAPLLHVTDNKLKHLI